MCVEITNTQTKQHAENVQEFAEMIGAEAGEMPPAHGYSNVRPGGCLCQVDVELACKMFGFGYNENTDFDIEIFKRETN